MERAEIRFLHALESAGDTREDARENHAAVAARAEQHAVCRELGGLSERARIVGQRDHARVDGHEHIFTRVAVGDREHVEVVDLGFFIFQCSRAVFDHRGKKHTV